MHAMHSRDKKKSNIYEYNGKQKVYFQTELCTIAPQIISFEPGNMFSMKWNGLRDTVCHINQMFFFFRLPSLLVNYKTQK